jgi:hypothetical protein
MGARRISLKPSLLVGASVSRSGGARYERHPLDERIDDDGSLTASWQTTKHVTNVDELKRAEAVVGELRHMLRTVCYPTAFGLVCSKDREKALDAVTEQIKAKVDEVNTELKTCRIAATVVKGEIKSNDKEAADAIVGEISGFLKELEAAIQTCDAKKIRQTVAAIRGVDTLLPDIQSKVLNDAVKAARKAATLIVREVEKKGKTIEAVRAELDLAPVDMARAYFLEPAADTVPAEVEPLAEVAPDALAAIEV